MDKIALNAEKDRILNALEDCDEGTDRYRQILGDLSRLQDLENSMLESEVKIECDKKKLELEELKVRNDAQQNELRYKAEKKTNRGRIAVAVLGLLGALGMSLFTIKEEETRAITSKAKQFGSDILNKGKY